jgi:hypothetical protein
MEEVEEISDSDGSGSQGKESPEAAAHKRRRTPLKASTAVKTPAKPAAKTPARGGTSASGRAHVPTPKVKPGVVARDSRATQRGAKEDHAAAV